MSRTWSAAAILADPRWRVAPVALWDEIEHSLGNEETTRIWNQACREADALSEAAEANSVVARQITFDAKREPMFQDEGGNGWVPIARFHELYDALVRIADLDTTETHHYGGFRHIAREALGRDSD